MNVRLQWKMHKNAVEKKKIAVLAKTSSCGQIFCGQSHMIFGHRFAAFPVMQICCLAIATVWMKLQNIRFYTDIYDDSEWLIGVVENLLSITRLNDGRLKFKFTDQLFR